MVTAVALGAALLAGSGCRSTPCSTACSNTPRKRCRLLAMSGFERSSEPNDWSNDGQSARRKGSASRDRAWFHRLASTSS